MKIKKYIALALGFILYLVFHMSMVSYDNGKTHPALNEEIIKKSVDAINNDANSHVSLNLKDKKLNGMAVTNMGLFQETYSESSVDYTPWEWIAHGGLSADEPETDAAIRHFYDPFSLSGHKYLTNRGTYWEGKKTNPGIDAIEWALGDTPKGAANPWTWEKGKKYMIEALNAGENSYRDQLMAKVWRCLGETLHNTGDMACPPHVRNDSHAAPLGWSGGDLLGSPDPYEERFYRIWASKYSNQEIDDEFANFLKNAQTARQINEKLALFTNTNFFSHETISGKDVDPANGEVAYGSPKLQYLNYDKNEFAYYSAMPSGRKVLMCKDYRFFSAGSRGTPYIDDECIESQASELVPYIIQSGKRIFQLFIPDLRIEIKPDKYSNVIEGRVYNVPNSEYKDQILYNGNVKVKTNGKEYVVNCINGKINQGIDGNPGDDWEATIEFCGLVYNSKSEGSSLKDFTNWTANFALSLLANDGQSYDEIFWDTDYRSKELNWSNNSFTAVWDTVAPNLKAKATLYFEADKEGKTITKVIFDEEMYYSEKKDGFDLFTDRKIHLILKPLKSTIALLDDYDSESGVEMKYLKLEDNVLLANVDAFSGTKRCAEPVYENGIVIDVKNKDLVFSTFDKTRQNKLAIGVFRKK